MVENNPSKLRGITWEEIGDLQVDQSGNLHWKGEKVKIEQRLSLRGFELALAAAATLATVIAAGVEVLRYLAESGLL